MEKSHHSIGRRWARVTGPRRRPGHGRPHAYYLAIGFPPAAKSSAYRMRETANQLYAHGWDVTVLTICQEAWEREFGLDHSLSADVHPAIRVVELPLRREELDTEIRHFSRARSLDPAAWAAEVRQRRLAVFPEPSFGGWAPALTEAILRLHRRDPADLLVTTCAPYVTLAPTWALWERHRVPYVVDFRDGWSIDVLGGEVAFPPGSIAGRWESRVLGSALEVWTVNDPIAGHYRRRYPAVAARVHVVRNGYDDDSVPRGFRAPDPERGLRFGYLGTITFPVPLLGAVLDGWRIARAEDPLLANAGFELRGHIGAGAAREDNAYAEMLRAAGPDGVRFGGPVPKAEVAAVYGEWDALVLIVPGGRYMTSGKVYEAYASGLPVVSAHEPEHDASFVLDGNPLWTGAAGPDADRLAESFKTAAKLALTATPGQRAATRAAAARFARAAQLAPAVRRVTEAVR
ncbi:glycosyl transferase [Actinoplanes oblitus]|uniref:Glycosyl transferase n=1 Tax=Actinoplanes oblitus TaxID=3040509 RepID=A0ABY8WFQ1_9ACTN|nr:glycosyl transferase [Actinoplanes oblitus]WIM95941.1 glycosyl transferase [Actinoplanes oblitus]